MWNDRRAAVRHATENRERAEQITLDGDRHAPRRARAALGRVLLEWGSHDLLPDAELLLSELVTNAVVHGRSPATKVDIRLDDRHVVVGVTDPGQSVDAVVPLAPGTTSAGGFGLRIVEQVASAWGVDAIPGGKRIWFALERPATVTTIDGAGPSHPMRNDAIGA